MYLFNSCAAIGIPRLLVGVIITHCHKSQMAYVAALRVQTLDRVRFRRPPTLSDLNKFARSKNKPPLDREMSRLGTLQAAQIEKLGVRTEEAAVRARL